jgi:hypothetical protein
VVKYNQAWCCTILGVKAPSRRLCTVIRQHHVNDTTVLPQMWSSWADNTSVFFLWNLPVIRISPPSGLRAQGRVSPVLELPSLASGQACCGMEFPPFLTKQLYRWDSVVIASFVETGYTTRRWGWLLSRSGCSISHHYSVYIYSDDNKKLRNKIQNKPRNTIKESSRSVRIPPKVLLLWRSGGACVVTWSQELCWR